MCAIGSSVPREKNGSKEMWFAAVFSRAKKLEEMQTLSLRIENNKQGSSIGMRTHSGISPLFTMFNHDCNPAAKWDCIGELRGPMAVVAKRDINEGEEISVAYVDVNGRERERRDQLVGQIGRMCGGERGACYWRLGRRSWILEYIAGAREGGEGLASEENEMRDHRTRLYVGRLYVGRLF